MCIINFSLSEMLHFNTLAEYEHYLMSWPGMIFSNLSISFVSAFSDKSKDA